MTVTIKIKFKNVDLELTKEEASELASVLGGLVHKDTPWYPIYVSPWYPTRPYLYWKWDTTSWDITSGATYTVEAR